MIEMLTIRGVDTHANWMNSMQIEFWPVSELYTRNSFIFIENTLNELCQPSVFLLAARLNNDNKIKTEQKELHSSLLVTSATKCTIVRRTYVVLEFSTIITPPPPKRHPQHIILLRYVYFSLTVWPFCNRCRFFNMNTVGRR